MKKSDLYLLLSGCALILTFLTGFGFILSAVLLYLIHTEKKKLKKEVSTIVDFKEVYKIVDFKTENRKLIIAQILCVIDILICLAIFGFLIYMGLGYFGFVR